MDTQKKAERRFNKWIAAGQLVLLAATFFLSVGVAFPQLINFVRGPDVEVYLPDRIIFHKYEVTNKGSEDDRLRRYYVRLSASMSYTNTGGRDYPAIVQQEIIAMRFCESERDGIKCDAKSYDQKWQTFETFEVANDGKIKSKSRKPAIHRIIDGRAAISHDTYFAPFPVPCYESKNEDDFDKWGNYLEWDEFIEKAMKADEIRITTISKSLAVRDIFENVSRENSFSCAIEVNPYMIYMLTNESWYSPSSCREIRES